MGEELGSRRIAPDEGAVERAEQLENVFVDKYFGLETVVRLLIRKGVFTADELAQEVADQRRREIEQHAKFVWALAEQKAREHHSTHRGYRRPRSWLKRVMAKRRWTRRLGTFLFGWKWKKVSHHRHRISAEPSEERR